MPDRPTADRTAELLFWYARKRSRYHAEGRRRDAPRLDPEVILKLALGRPVKFADASWNDPAKVNALQQAACAYVRQIFFRPDPTPYQVLGLEPGASLEAIKECFRLLMQLVHPDRQGDKKRWPDACAAQANWAHAMLRDHETRRTFEEEADARAALARAINRASKVAEASQMPTVSWPKKFGKGERPFAGAGMPEWLTADAGGYARHHPRTTAFVALITMAALVIGASLWEGREGMLIRVAREEANPSNARTPLPAADDVTSVTASTSRGTSATGTAAGDRPIPPLMPSGVAVGRPRSDVVATASAETSDASAGAPSESPVASVAFPTLEPRTLSVAIGAPPVATPVPPAAAEVDAIFATFVEAYERGRLDTFAALFDDDADTNLRRGRAAIRGEYDELFRLSQWRRMQLTRMSWHPVGDRAVANGEITVRIGWRDGREVEQRVNVNMELVRRDGRVVIARLSHQPKNP